MKRLLPVLLTLVFMQTAMAVSAEFIWQRHAIHTGNGGSDGVRLTDVNGDGLPDAVTAWEQANKVRAYIHPGYASVELAWPFVQVNANSTGEDAVFADIDGDGQFDVVSAHEGASPRLMINFAPVNPADYMTASLWTHKRVDSTATQQPWMFSVPVQIDGLNGLDIVAGGKSTGAYPAAAIGWWAAPANPRTGAWVWHKMAGAYWTMSLIPSDMDGDGDLDVIYSDRQFSFPNDTLCGRHAGTGWLENPGVGNGQDNCWTAHMITSGKHTVMFSHEADVDGDGLPDVVSASRSSQAIIFSRRLSVDGLLWAQTEIPIPATVGKGKGVSVGDINLDGVQDIALSTEASGLEGVVWLSYSGDPTIVSNWTIHTVSGIDGEKYDIVQLYDIDGDGDLDIVTTEEIDDLGVIWYENPTIP